MRSLPLHTGYIKLKSDTATDNRTKLSKIGHYIHNEFKTTKLKSDLKRTGQFIFRESMLIFVEEGNTFRFF